MPIQRVFLIVVLLLGAASVPVMAQDANQNPDANPGLDAAAQATARLQQTPESKVVSVYVMGNVEVVGGGKVAIHVNSARETNGVGLHALVGKRLTVTGKCLRQLEQMPREKVELRGEVKDNKEFNVLSFTQRRMPSAAESARVQGARGSVGEPIGAINVPGAGERVSASGNRVPIGALNDPQGAGVNKPNRGVIGALQGRKKPTEEEARPGADLPVVAVVGALR